MKTSEARQQATARGPNFSDRAKDLLDDIETFDTSHLPTSDLDLLERAGKAEYISEGAFMGIRRIHSRLKRENGGY